MKAYAIVTSKLGTNKTRKESEKLKSAINIDAKSLNWVLTNQIQECNDKPSSSWVFPKNTRTESRICKEDDRFRTLMGTGFLTEWQYREVRNSAHLGSTYTKIGTTQRLAWSLRKDDMQIWEAFHIFYTEWSKKEEHQYSILTHIYGI